MTQNINEFDIIRDLFAPLAGQAGLDLQDDAACWRPPSGCDVVLSTDMLVCGVHFPEAAAADVVAMRLLGCALSDLAAKGAEPIACLLTLAIAPDWDRAFLSDFASAFGRGLAQYNVALWGGDTVAAPVASVALSVYGSVPHDTMITRSGAQNGDDVYVSGTIGDGFLGLQDIRAGKGGKDNAAYTAPRPQLDLGQQLRGIAHACVDISDGLVADLDHICRASHVGIDIEAARVPLSVAGQAYLAEGKLADLLAGGDDYQLAFTAPRKARDALAALDAPLTMIGRVVARDLHKAQVYDEAGQAVAFTKRGFTHF